MLTRALAVALLLVALAGPGSAAAAGSPCSKRVTLDWAEDGTVNGTYPRACFEEAIASANARPDLAMYTSIVDDLRAAMRRGTPIAETTSSPVVTSASGHDGDGDSGGSVPLPLVLLGGAAVVLVAGGAGGMAWKRLRRRP
jgi:hypothetical protein